MEATEQIKIFKEFFERNYKAELLESVRKGKTFLVVDFASLAVFNPELADLMIEQPDEVLRAAEIATEQFDLPPNIKKITIRTKNLPNSQKILIRNVRSAHLGKLLSFDGIVRQKSDVRPQVTQAKFECPSCGNIISVLQLDTKFKEPTRCGCGRKGKFRLIHKELVDAQGLVLEESPENLEGGEQPKRMNVFLKNDLVSPISEKRTNPGQHIKLTGVVKEVPIITRQGTQSTRFDLLIEGNYVESVEEDYSDIKISEEEEKEIEELSRDPKLLRRLVNSIAPSIFGHEKIKEALILQMLGGVKKVRDDGSVTRGDMHVLLIGDPGAGKCLSGNTKIMLQNGDIIPIKDLSENRTFIDKKSELTPIGLPSLGFNGQIGYNSAVRLWKRPCKELLKFRTRTGKQLEVTKNHPLFVLKNGFVVAKHAEDLKIGDRIATPRQVPIQGSLQILPKTVMKNFSNESKNSKAHKYPEIIERNMCRFLGYLCGDGYDTNTLTTGTVNLTLTNNNEEVIKDFAGLCKTLFNSNPTIRNPHKGKSTIEASVSSKGIQEYLKRYFFEITGKTNKKTIPTIVLRSKNTELSEFIKALFECDSHVNTKKRQIEYATISKDLAEKVQMSLLRFGVVSLLKQKTKSALNTENKRKVEAYEIVIAERFVNKYAEEIGYISINKTQQLKKIIESGTQHNTNMDLVPGVNILLKEIRTELNLTQKEMGIPDPSYAHYERGNKLPSKFSLKKIYKYLEERYDTKNVRLLGEIANADIFWDEILDIQAKQNEEEYVYDFEVETTHNYIANGVVVHNSQLLKRVSHVAPKARYVSGKGASGAGLTASVVRDEFLSGWSLEAGALVLANKGICVTGDTEILIENNELQKIETIHSSFMKGNKIRVFSLNDKTLKTETKEILNVSKREPESLLEVRFDTGQKLKITPEHPVPYWNNKIEWKPIGELKKGDYIINTKSYSETDGKKRISVTDLLSDSLFVRADISSFNTKGVAKTLDIPRHRLNNKNKIRMGDLRKISKYLNLSLDEIKIRFSHINQTIDVSFMEFAGMVATDGHISKNKNNISFYNSNSENLIRYKQLVNSLFGIEPSVYTDKRTGIIRIYFSSAEVKDLLNGIGISSGNKTSKGINSEIIYNMTSEHVRAFIVGSLNGDGCISNRKSGGIAEIISGSEKTAETYQKLFYKLGVISKVNQYTSSGGGVVDKQKGVTYKTSITGRDNIKKLDDLRLISYKLRNIREIIKRKGKSIRVPNIDKFIEQLFNTLPHGKKALLYLNSIRKLQRNKTFEKNTIKKINTDLSKQGIKVPTMLSKLVWNEVYFSRIESVKNVPVETVYNIEVDSDSEPNYFANFIPVHNCMIDELDKMGVEDRAAMHEALEQQTVTISKANIQATLRSETTVLAAANPKFGRFDPYETLAKQIDLPATLINRFDLIFPIRDLPDPEKDAQMAEFILRLHKEPDSRIPEIPTSLIRKYFAYAKQKYKPVLTEAAVEELKKYYLKMRGSGTEDGNLKSIPISARQIEALIRLAEASAKMRLSQKVQKKDAKRSVELVHYCLSQVGMDPETGQIDIDRISTGVGTSERNKIVTIREVIHELESSIGKTIPMEEIVRSASTKGLDEDTVDDVIQRLKRSGDIFEPKSGFIQRI